MNQDEIVQKVRQYIDNIVRVEGEIDKVIPFGNSVIVKFKNGASYKQPFISREVDGEVTLDYNRSTIPTNK